MRIPLFGILFVLFAVVLGLHAGYYMPFLSDDALISLRYTDRLLDGHGLTWTPGHPVEGYSNLLWVLLTAVLGLLRMDLILAARVLGVSCHLLIIVSVLICYRQTKPLKVTLTAIVLGLLFFTLTAPVAVWTIGGLEQPLYAGLLAVAIPLCWRVQEAEHPSTWLIFAASLPLGLMCLTRPDGPLFTVAALTGLTATRLLDRSPWSWRVFWLLVIPVLCYGGQLVFRLVYYGEYVPNTALVKLTPSPHHFANGLTYVWHGLLSLAPLSFLALLFLILGCVVARSRGRVILLLMIVFHWLPYVMFVGGDIFPAYRHFVPMIVVFLFALIEGSLVVGHWLSNRSLRYRLVTSSIVAFGLMIFVVVQFRDSENHRAVEERWEWDGQVLGLLLHDAFADKEPLLAVSAAGCLPYWSKLPCVDMLGLNDHYLPRHPPKDLGQGKLGHELGSGPYILKRRPDIICFDLGREKALFRSGRELQQLPAFARLYTPVRVRGTVPHEYTATLWFWKNSDKIGIRYDARQIRIPGYLLNVHPHTRAFMDNGRLVSAVQITKPAAIRLEGLSVNEGQILVRGSEPNKIHIRCRHDERATVVELHTTSGEPLIVSALIIKR